MNSDELGLKNYVKIKVNGEYGQVIKIEGTTDFNSDRPLDLQIRLFKSLRAVWFKPFELEKVPQLPPGAKQ